MAFYIKHLLLYVFPHSPIEFHKLKTATTYKNNTEMLQKYHDNFSKNIPMKKKTQTNKSTHGKKEEQ